MNTPRTLLLIAALSLAACARPEPPKITPISGRVTGISPTGIDVEAKLEGENPNDVDLTVKSCTAKVTLDGKYDIGTVTAPHSIKLPAHKKTRFDMPISVKWRDVAALAPLGMTNRDVPYEADGTVRISVKSVELDLPFKVTGVLTHAQIMQAVARSIPKIPGITVP